MRQMKGRTPMRPEITRMIRIQLEDTAPAVLIVVLVLLLVIFLGGCAQLSAKVSVSCPDRALVSSRIRNEVANKTCPFGDPLVPLFGKASES